jgi:hypothetical protein
MARRNYGGNVQPTPVPPLTCITDDLLALMMPSAQPKIFSEIWLLGAGMLQIYIFFRETAFQNKGRRNDCAFPLLICMQAKMSPPSNAFHPPAKLHPLITSPIHIHAARQ